MQLPTDINITEDKIPNLADIESFVKTTCPKCGSDARRETDTCDTFIDSTWYYARYPSIDCTDDILDDKAKKWTPVDHYVGGIEHAILHLLYARFIHKFLYDLHYFDYPEPFKNLLTQGMVLKDGFKMSKSKGNVVDPEDLLSDYGADTIRLFIMFAAPCDMSLEWRESGVEGAYKFLKKLQVFAESNLAHYKAVNIDNISNTNEYLEIQKVLQQINLDYEKQHFNTVISGCMKLFNILNSNHNSNNRNQDVITYGLQVILTSLHPIAPHLCSYLYSHYLQVNIEQCAIYTPDTNILNKSLKEVIVQINGKKKGSVQLANNCSEQEAMTIVQEQTWYSNNTNGKQIIKIIYVPNRIINVVVK